MALLLATTIASAYTQEDWKFYDACKTRVYDKVDNGYDYAACKEMLSHKDALRKHGAASSYDCWIKRLYK
ncbi:MAG: hypothetical protein QG567_1361 [Campylobacterota bacterium]|nr:hypothetical protein [Campylobacterota bacterium]